jgi:hypothetical protein
MLSSLKRIEKNKKSFCKFMSSEICVYVGMRPKLCLKTGGAIPMQNHHRRELL